MTSLNDIRARHKTYSERAPAPVINRRDADQMHRDITALFAEIERLKAAP